MFQMSMSGNQKEVMINKLRAEKFEYEHFEYDVKELKGKFSVLQDKIKQLHIEKATFQRIFIYINLFLKEFKENEENNINDINYKEIAGLKTEIMLSTNEILIIDEELKDTREKTDILVDMNKQQDIYLTEIQNQLENIKNEHMELQENSYRIEKEVR